MKKVSTNGKKSSNTLLVGIFKVTTHEMKGAAVRQVQETLAVL
ncbi:hypothetical protein RFN66_10920 [Bacillus paralicheniformis]|nr:hypothetical protein [Bacillus paralicheniformis]WMW49400.1 hypothetical protein RFN66_10920 [Bacillus paralicheniformis]